MCAVNSGWRPIGSLSRWVPGISTFYGDGLGVGDGSTVNTPVKAEPFGVWTSIFPVVAPEGTYVVIFVEEKLPAACTFPANVIVSGEMKFVPVMTTAVPTAPWFGE